MRRYVAVGLGVITVGAVAVASDLPPWRDADDLPLPEGVRSVVVQKSEQAIVSDAKGNSPRRGTAQVGAKLPWFGAKRGPGCEARWIGVGPEAWICQSALTFDPGPPLDAVPTFTPSGVPQGLDRGVPGGLPFRYYFVGRAGSNGYSRLEDAEDVAPDQELEPGFAVAVVDEGVKGGSRYVRTHHGMWLPMRDLAQVVPFLFHGEEVKEGALDFAWVVQDKTVVLSAPGAPPPKGKGAALRAKFDKVDILEERKEKSGGYFRIGDGQWLRARDVRRPVVSPPPSSLPQGERWLDVDLTTQTLVAYEGDRPVYATLVSTGKGKEGTDAATPKGEFRIWVKLLSSNMDNLEDEEAMKYYAIEDVPYVQYFSNGIGLHGAFWHRGFGQVRSHGCVNLAPLDGQRLFAFTSPHLPAGWTAVLPTQTEEGTLVRVR
jgi:lipoprotein-anchoring transpeptidase ErfK/SrfK